jgi:hypothetical protein
MLPLPAVPGACVCMHCCEGSGTGLRWNRTASGTGLRWCLQLLPLQVEAVGDSVPALAEGLQEQQYNTKTRGMRVQGAAHALGEGVVSVLSGHAGGRGFAEGASRAAPASALQHTMRMAAAHSGAFPCACTGTSDSAIAGTSDRAIACHAW